MKKIFKNFKDSFQDFSRIFLKYFPKSSHKNNKKQVGLACVISLAPTFEILFSSWDISFQSSCGIPTNVIPTSLHLELPSRWPYPLHFQKWSSMALTQTSQIYHLY